jgi:hypothetical protein
MDVRARGCADNYAASGNFMLRAALTLAEELGDTVLGDSADT